MQKSTFLKVSPVENVSFFQKEMFEGGYLSSYNFFYSHSHRVKTAMQKE
jgi:hypothetical protein